MEKLKTFIFDIDGTISDNSHRVHFIEQNPKDWKSFFSQCVNDPPIEETMLLLKTLSSHYIILLVSGRREKDGKNTQTWLFKHGVPYLEMFLRKDGDFRPDTVVKKEIYEECIKDNYNVLGVFEDRKSVVEMWRSLGLKCYSVCEGDY